MKKLAALMIPLPLLVCLFAACSSDDTAEPADASSADVTPDKKVTADVVVPEAGPGCAPAPIAGFVPEWIPPVDPQPTACSDTQINDYFAKC